MVNTILDIETSGLNAMENKITSIAIDIDGKTYCFVGEDEKKILEDFWKIYVPSVLITFAGDGFDIPFLLKRSLVNNVKIKKIIKSVDLRKIVNGFWYNYNKYEKGTLTDWAVVLGMEVETHNGKMMLEYYNKKEWDKIKAHCEEDVCITKALYKRCKDCGLIK